MLYFTYLSIWLYRIVFVLINSKFFNNIFDKYYTYFNLNAFFYYGLF